MNQFVKKLFVLFIFIQTYQIWSQTTYYFIGSTTSTTYGDASDLNNWYDNTSGSGGANPTTLFVSGDIYDLNGHNIDIANCYIDDIEFINTSTASKIKNSGKAYFQQALPPTFSGTGITLEIKNEGTIVYTYNALPLVTTVANIDYYNLDMTQSCGFEIATTSATVTIYNKLMFDVETSTANPILVVKTGGTLVLGSSATIEIGTSTTSDSFACGLYVQGTLTDNRSTKSYPLTFKNEGPSDIIGSKFFHLFVSNNAKLTENVYCSYQLSVGSNANAYVFNLNNYTITTPRLSAVRVGTTSNYNKLNISGTSKLVLVNTNAITLAITQFGTATNSNSIPNHIEIAGAGRANISTNLTVDKLTISKTGINFSSTSANTLTIKTSLTIIDNNSGNWVTKTSSSINHKISLTSATSPFPTLIIKGNGSTLTYPSGFLLNSSVDNLEIDFPSSGTFVLPENFTINKTLNLNSTSGNYLNINGFQLTLKGDISNASGNSGGKIIGSSSSNLICSTGTFTVYFDQSSINNYTLRNLTLANGASCTLGNNLTLVNGVDLGTGNLTIGSNTLTFSGTSTQPITRTTGTINPTNSTIKYAQTSANGNNNLLTAAYSSNIYNLILDFTSGGTLIPDGSMTIGNSLTMTTASNYFNINGNTITVNGSISTNSGLGKFIGSNTSNLICSTASTTLYFDQTSTSNYSLNSLTLSNNSSYSLGGNLIIVDKIDLGTGNLNVGSNTLSFNGTNTQPISTTSGLINALSATINYAQTSTNGNNDLLASVFSNNIYNLIVNFQNGGTLTPTSSLTIGNTIDLVSGTFTVGGHTLTFSGTAAQPILRTSGFINPTNSTIKYAQTSTNGSNSLLAAAYSSNLHNLTIEFANGGTLTPTGSVNVGSTLSMNTANNYFNIDGTTLTIAGNILNTLGTNGGKFKGSNTSNLICSTANVGTLYFDQSTTSSSTLQNLTLANGASCTLGSNLILTNGVDLGTSNLTVGSNTLTFAGSSATWITRNGGRINTTGSTIKYAQTSTAGTDHSIELAAYTSNTTGNLNNLTIDFANACTFTPPNNMTIDGTLNLSGTNNTFVLNGTTLTVSGSVTSTGGKFKGSSTSILNCSGTSSLYFDQTSASTKTLKKLHIQGNNASVTLANELNITGGTNYGSVEVTAASSTLTTGNNLTLKSDANGTARIANSPGTISGNYYAEQYFPANREYRFICAPVVGATALQWRNNGSTTSHTGLGISITGANPSSNSFDASTANKPSAFWYDETIAGSVTNVNSTGTDDPGWTSISNGNSYGLTNGKGFRVLVRGDRDIDLTKSSPSPSTTTITSYGTYPRTSGSSVVLNVTNTNRTSETNNGLNLVGNPFPSAIDWNSIALSNVDNGYATYDPVGHKYVAWNGSLGDATRYISSGQAFFVMCTNSGTGTLTVEEADKYDGKGGNFFLEKLSNHMRINLMYDSTYNSDAFIHFRDDASDVKDVYDIQQFYVNGTNIASLDENGKPYKINSLKTLDSLTVVPLSIAGTPEASLKLSFYDIPSFYGYKLELVDTYLKKTVEITEGMIYNLDITSDSFTVKDGRFYINIAKIPGLKNRSFESNKIANIYPNPIQDKMAIRLDKKITQANYEIFNSIGQLITKGSIESPESTINTSSYSNGTYYLIVKTNNSSQTIQFVK